ncbi:MAG: leucyl/phenylalanyl-tRNA--protein transferase [Lysobacterales bacterium]
MWQLPVLGSDPAAFPPASQARVQPNGLLAMGGDLSPERVQQAYRRGIFPWYSEQDPILWWSPHPRLVLEPDAFKPSRSLRKRARSCGWQLSIDRAFLPVIHACAQTPRPGQDGTWIVRDIESAYARMHRLGLAHSIEIWDGTRLLGGLYGLALGRMFFGESMFSRVPDASKLALWALCTQLQRWGWPLIDCQVETAHLISLGAQSWPRERFLDAVGAHAQPPDIWRADTLPRTPVDLHDWLMAP